MKAKVLLAAVGAVSIFLSAASNSSSPSTPQIAVKLARAVNTAEMRHFMKTKEYLGWNELKASDEWQELVNSSKEPVGLAGVDIRDSAETIPGYRLRLVVNNNPGAYQFAIVPVEQCGKGFFGGEDGLIHIGITMGCEAAR